MLINNGYFRAEKAKLKMHFGQINYTGFLIILTCP